MRRKRREPRAERGAHIDGSVVRPAVLGDAAKVIGEALIGDTLGWWSNGVGQGECPASFSLTHEPGDGEGGSIAYELPEMSGSVLLLLPFEVTHLKDGEWVLRSWVDTQLMSLVRKYGLDVRAGFGELLRVARRGLSDAEQDEALSQMSASIKSTASAADAWREAADALEQEATKLEQEMKELKDSLEARRATSNTKEN